MKWRRIMPTLKMRASGTFAIANDGAKIMTCPFDNRYGENRVVSRMFYAYGPRGVTEWMKSAEACAAAYEAMSED